MRTVCRSLARADTVASWDVLDTCAMTITARMAKMIKTRRSSTNVNALWAFMFHPARPCCLLSSVISDRQERHLICRRPAGFLCQLRWVSDCGLPTAICRIAGDAVGGSPVGGVRAANAAGSRRIRLWMPTSGQVKEPIAARNIVHKICKARRESSTRDKTPVLEGRHGEIPLRPWRRHSPADHPGILGLPRDCI